MTPLTRLAGSLTRLAVLEGILTPILPKLTRLRELLVIDCYHEPVPGTIINAALPQLTQLTCLVSGRRE